MSASCVGFAYLLGMSPGETLCRNRHYGKGMDGLFFDITCGPPARLAPPGYGLVRFCNYIRETCCFRRFDQSSTEWLMQKKKSKEARR